MTTYNTEVLNDAPFMYFKIDETSGTSIANAGSDTYATPMSIGSGFALNQPGISNTGAVLDGSANAYATHLQLSGAFPSTGMSVEFWVKTSDTGQVMRWGAVGATDGWSVNITSTGKVQFRRATSLTITSAKTINDNVWHHIVVTMTNSTGAAIMYVDGAVDQNLSGQSIANFSSNYDFYLGDNSTSAIAGSIDEFATYKTVLSATRVSAHYNAGNPVVPVSINYAATPMTANATMPSGDFPASPMTASATMVDPVVKTNTQRVAVSDDTYTASSAPTSTHNTSTTLYYGTGFAAFFHIPAATLGTGQTVASKKITLTAAIGFSASTIRVYSVNAAWSSSTLTNSNQPTGTLVKSVSVPATSAGGTFDVDFTGVDTTNGLCLESSDPTFQSYSHNGSSLAIVTYGIDTATPVSVSATPMTASGAMVDPVVSLGLSVSVAALPMTANSAMVDPVTSTGLGVSESAQAMTANAVTVDPTLYVKHDQSVAATPLTATADMGQNSGYTVNLSVTAAVATADADIVAAPVTTTRGVIFLTSPMTATATEVQAESVNGNPIIIGEGDDPYFARVSKQTPMVWWRLQDRTTNVADRAAAIIGPNAGSGKTGTYNNVQFGRADAPNKRASAYFDGTGYISENTPLDEAASPVDLYAPMQSTLEFSIRTTQGDSYLAYSIDEGIGALTTNIYEGWRDIYLKNGLITYTYNGVPELTGRTNLADGQWHHIVIQSSAGDFATGRQHGVEIYIDGKFEVRRFVVGGLFGMPDYFGGLPGTAIVPRFVGDFSEIVFHGEHMTTEEIARNYYAFMGWDPIEPLPMTATATAVDATGRGNQKRALYLAWELSDVIIEADTSTWENLDKVASFDPFGGSFTGGDKEYMGFKAFHRSIGRTEDNQNYYDPWTDETRLIDLDLDVNLDDYDIIMFRDWPMSESARNWVDANWPGQRERLVNQILAANEKGIGLYVTHPMLAVELGIIDRVEWCEPLTEGAAIPAQGNAMGLYDYGSAVKFPWDIVTDDGIVSGGIGAAGTGTPETTDPAFLSNKAYFYFDNNRNNKFRVRALVQNLTDIPSYMIEDAVFHVDFDPFGNSGYAAKYLHRMEGLQIGDEYIFNGAAIDWGMYLDLVASGGINDGRRNGAWATPMDNVKAGTVVTTFGSTMYQGKDVVDNPYSDYATTIVVQPGDNLNGKTVNGKIFVNFTEAPSQGLGVDVQVLPGSPDDADNPLRVDPSQMITDSSPVFVSQGTAEQNAWLDTVLSNCTFPYDALKGMLNDRYGRTYIPVLWQDIDPGTNTTKGETAGEFVPADGTLILDEAAIRDAALMIGSTFDNMLGAVFIHETGHMVDHVYLKPYQRVNIWNVFHGDWNIAHTSWIPVPLSEFILPPDYIINTDTVDIVQGEGWLGGGSYAHAQVGEAFANAFVEAYSNYSTDTHQYDPHPSPSFIGPMIKAAIETGPGAYIFTDEQANTGWPAGYIPDTDAQREWEYSWTRTSAHITAAAANTSTRTISILLPDGTRQQITTQGGIDPGLSSMLKTLDLFPVIGKPRWEMGGRGIYWLASDNTVADGGITIRAQAVTATAEMPNPVVTAQHDTVVPVGAMLGMATEVRPAEALPTDIDVLALPMEAGARLNGIGATIAVAPMTASADIVDDFHMVHAQGERVILTLHGYNATLFIKEET